LATNSDLVAGNKQNVNLDLNKFTIHFISDIVV